MRSFSHTHPNRVFGNNQDSLTAGRHLRHPSPTQATLFLRKVQELDVYCLDIYKSILKNNGYVSFPLVLDCLLSCKNARSISDLFLQMRYPGQQDIRVTDIPVLRYLELLDKHIESYIACHVGSRDITNILGP